MQTHSPLKLLARALILWLRGRVHHSGGFGADAAEDCDGDFVPFRLVTLDPVGDQPESPAALFTVRFHFARFGAWTNRLLSLIPIPFIVAQPGFRSKRWLTNHETGEFMGIYRWDSLPDAENYWTSFPMRLMRRRAAPGTLVRVIRAVEPSDSAPGAQKWDRIKDPAPP